MCVVVELPDTQCSPRWDKIDNSGLLDIKVDYKGDGKTSLPFVFQLHDLSWPLTSDPGSFMLPKFQQAINSLPKLVIHEGASCQSGCTNLSFTCDDVGANFFLERCIVNPRAVGIHTMTWTVSDRGNTGFYDDSGVAPSQQASASITFDVFLPVISPDPNRYVSLSNGSDAEGCGTKNLPCRTLSRAIAGTSTCTEFLAILTKSRAHSQPAT